MRLAVLTTGRQDWGLLQPLCAALRDCPGFELVLLAGGMACDSRFGDVRGEIAAAGFEVAAELGWDAAHTAAPEQAARALAGVADALAVHAPDALVLLGDRYETAAAALAATLERVPIVHLHGGEKTSGAIDDALRHAITKLAHLHLVAHPEYAERLRRMGEDPETIHVIGSLGGARPQAELPGRAELERALGLSLEAPLGVVTLHPTTLAGEPPELEAKAVCEAMRQVEAGWVITLPNADPGHEAIRAELEAFAASHPRAVAVPALGAARYRGLVRLADFVLGNSSSGILEAPALGTPTVNVGDRQQGRRRADSVLDVAPDPGAIASAIRTACSAAFRQRLSAPPAPGADPAATAIAILQTWRPPHPPRKK